MYVQCEIWVQREVELVPRAWRAGGGFGLGWKDRRRFGGEEFDGQLEEG